MTLMRGIRNASILILMLAFFLPETKAQNAQGLEQDDPEELLHFAYSSLFGSGYYKVGERSVGVVELPFSIETKVAGEDHLYGFKWLLPISFGLHSFDPDDILEDSDRVSTLSFVPGVELHFPLASGWQLRPYAQLGYAFDVSSSSENAYVYHTGVKARQQLVPLEANRIGLTWGIRGALAGYKPENGNDNSLGFVSAGFDTQWPLPFKPRGNMTFLGVSLYANYYYETARFANVTAKEDESKYETTIALAFGFAGGKRQLNIPFDRIGIGYKRGNDVRAILLVTDFPF